MKGNFDSIIEDNPPAAVDQNREIASRFNIQGVPTLMVFKNGEIKYKQSGVHSKSQLINAITNNLSK